LGQYKFVAKVDTAILTEAHP